MEDWLARAMNTLGIRRQGAAAVVQPTFDEAMCQRFNQFYDVIPTTPGRVRPTFHEVEPRLELVACSDYTPPKRSGVSMEITPEFQRIFLGFFY
jgi:hypothetical protein